MERNMVIRSTQLRWKEIHKETWKSPDGKTVNQIDHVLIERTDMNFITKVKSMRGAECNSDHYLVKVACMGGWEKKAQKKIPKDSKIKFNSALLTNQEIKNKYREQIEAELATNIPNTEVEEIWEKVKTTIAKANEEILTKTARKGKIKDWYDEECEKAADVVKRAKQSMLTKESEETKEEYKNARRAMKKLCRRKKRKDNENKLKDIEEKFQNKEIRSFYQEVKKMEAGYQNRSTYIKSKDGLLICETTKVLERWKDYFQELLNSTTEEEIVTLCDMEGNDLEVETPTKQEVINIISNFKNNKSPGATEITAEMLKAGGSELHEQIYRLVSNIWEEESMPRDWTMARICPIHKKGDKQTCENYRGIALLETGYKILAQCLRKRLNEYMEKTIGEYQAGFRQNRSVTDQIFTLKEIQANCYEYKEVLHVLFVDFRQAYDQINRKRMYQALKELKIPNKLIKLVKMTLDNARSEVVWKGVSEDFENQQGLRQGDPMSTTLFNFILEVIIRNSSVKTVETIMKNEHQCIAFADDLTIMARTRKELKRIVKRIIKEAKQFGLRINEKKTKYMIMGDTEKDKEEYLEIQEREDLIYRFERVKEFTYLGVKVTENGHEDKEVEARITKGNKKYGVLRSLMKSNFVSRKTKERVYKTVIRATVMYASETWVLKKAEEEKLERWERKILRSIYGGKHTEMGWRRRTNKELETLYKEPKITAVIKAQRIRWLGHVQRLENSRMTKIILNRKPIGKKRKGRPRKRWYDSVQNDLQTMGISDWRNKAVDRTFWRGVVMRAQEQL